ncbi:hypothetical protein F2P81_006381 [Scophthalmus maximus]|uniref:Uncharacterized protein n=1 Tax=Scophthalmus maximus TaxID=52904 RepID=A0A6A4T326_SCOMX|nr:hypothetical protein F2P81_006381 [Scophthalmus maximus]
MAPKGSRWYDGEVDCRFVQIKNNKVYGKKKTKATHCDDLKQYVSCYDVMTNTQEAIVLWPGSFEAVSEEPLQSESTHFAAAAVAAALHAALHAETKTAMSISLLLAAAESDIDHKFTWTAVLEPNTNWPSSPSLMPCRVPEPVSTRSSTPRSTAASYAGYQAPLSAVAQSSKQCNAWRTKSYTVVKDTNAELAKLQLTWGMKLKKELDENKEQLDERKKQLAKDKKQLAKTKKQLEELLSCKKEVGTVNGMTEVE